MSGERLEQKLTVRFLNYVELWAMREGKAEPYGNRAWSGWDGMLSTLGKEPDPCHSTKAAWHTHLAAL